MPFCLYNKKNITRRLEDINFIFEWQNNILRTSAAYAYPYLTYAYTLWGNNYNAPLSHVKLQNKTVSIINDVPLMESITPQ